MKMEILKADRISVLIEEAKNAVAHIKEERLREIAFERVLDHFLNKASFNFADDKITRQNNLREPVRKVEAKQERSTKSSGPKAWLAELIEEGFFESPKAMKDMIAELENRSHHLKATDLTLPLQDFCHDKKLRRKPKVKGQRLEWVNW